MKKNISPLLVSTTIIIWGFYNQNIITSLLMILFLIFFYTKNIKNIAFYTKLSFWLSFFLFTIIFYHYFKISPIVFAPSVIQALPIILFPILTSQYLTKEKYINLNYVFKNIKTHSIKIDNYFIAITLVIITYQSKYYKEIVFISFISWILYQKRKILSIIHIIFISIIIILSLNLEPILKLSYHDLIKTITKYLSNKDINLIKLNTAIGDIGKLKEINKIDYRLKPIKGNKPRYLRISDYSLYYDGSWLNKEYKFKKFTHKKDIDVNSFYLISDFNEKQIIPAPINLNNIQEKNASFYLSENFTIKRNGENSYSKIKFNSSKNSSDKKINNNDLKVPKNELPAIEKIIEKLKLNTMNNPKRILKKLNNFFENEFKYSLNLEKNTSKTTNLGNFLLNSKKGHCEYFASATTLILRRLGIHTRYTVGYYVNEFSKLEDLYILRTRHRHAWTRVFIDNKWINFDTTPSYWFVLENNNFSFLYKVGDLISFLYYKLKKSNILQLKNLLILLIIIFILLQRKKIKFNMRLEIKNKDLRKIDKVLKNNKISRNENIPLMKFIQDCEIAEHDKEKLIKLVDRYYDNNFSN